MEGFLTPPPVKTEGTLDERAAAPAAGLAHALIPRSALRLQSDERLVRLVCEGSDRAFEAVVERYRRPLLKYCGRRLGADRCEDVVQQAFFNAYRALHADNRWIDLKPWLYSIAHNLAVNALAKSGFNHEQLDENHDGVPQPPQVFERQERFRSLIGRIEHLPPRQRSALLLREFEGRDYHEIAGVLGSTVAAATELARRARISVRDGLGLLVPLDSMRAWLVTTSSTGLDPQRVGELVRGAEVGGGALKAGVAALLAGSIVAGAAVTDSERHSANRNTSNDRGSAVEQRAAGGNAPFGVPLALDPHLSAKTLDERGGNGQRAHDGGHHGKSSGDSEAEGERAHGKRPLPGGAPFPPGLDDDRVADGHDEVEDDDAVARPPRKARPDDDGADDDRHGGGGPGPSGSDEGPGGDGGDQGDGDRGGGDSSGPGGPDDGGGDGDRGGGESHSHSDSSEGPGN